MTAEEIIAKLLEKIDNVEDFDDLFDEIRNLESDPGNDSVWEQRYNKLKDAYVKRWGDETKPGTVTEVVKEAEEENELNVEDLDLSFDGRTE